MRVRRILHLAAVLSFCCVGLGTAGMSQTDAAAIEERIDGLISQMTLEEKAYLLSGDTTNFDSRPLTRLGIPAFRMTDGPVGVRWDKSCAFPVSVCMAATWNPDLIYQVGQALGQEAKGKGRNTLLGPCVNIHRAPMTGRNFESFGEDPFLAGRIAASYVRGVQSEKVIATTKHFACNNQEFERNSIDARVDERTLHEIYLPAFRAAVQEGGTWAIMSSYNRLNGHYASANTWLLTDLLKNDWGFKGFVMSDWGAVHSVEPTLYAGLDLEMPNGRYLNVDNVVETIHEGRMKETKIDAKVRRMLRAMAANGYFEKEIPDGGSTDTPEHRAVALKIAQEGIVLLKNDKNLLPIDRQTVHSIAVIGPNATRLRTGGGGSSRVQPNEAMSPFDAVRIKAGEGIDVRLAQGLMYDADVEPIPAEYLQPPDGYTGPGLLGRYYANREFAGDPVLVRVDRQINFDWGSHGPKGVADDYFSVTWEGKLIPPQTSLYALAIGSDDGSRLFLNDSLLVDNWGQHGVVVRMAFVTLRAGEPVNIRIEFDEAAGDAAMSLSWKAIRAAPLEEAIETAQKSDMAIVFAGYSDQFESEGFDRSDLFLPSGQAELIQKVAAVNPNTVVVLNSGAAVDMRNWIDVVPALIEAWYPGQEGGKAIADILFGEVNPSGKLVTSFMKQWEDCPAYGNYPGEDDTEHYAEGVFVGYRYFDTKDIAVNFPFGHGLSYTHFQYSGLKVSKKTIQADKTLDVQLTVTNAGDRDGAEVVQLYVGDDKASVPRPKKELKGFQKVFLKAGQSKTVQIKLKPEDLAFWDICRHDWKVESGKFTLYVGSSSEDIRLTGSIEVK
jgi:beta-glucosidase